MSDLGLPMTRRNVRRHRRVVLHPTIALDIRFGIERLATRATVYSKAAADRPESPHASTWLSFATLLSGEARALAAAASASLDAVGDRLRL